MGNKQTSTPVQKMLEEIKDDIVDAEKKADHALERKEAQKRIQKLKELNQLEEDLNEWDAQKEEEKANKKQPRHFLFDYIYRKKVSKN
jgi:hypothetical protein